MPHAARRRHWISAALVLCVGAASGCAPLDDLLRRDGTPWPLFVSPMVVLGIVVAALAFSWRTYQLDRWDLSVHAHDPSPRNIFIVPSALGVLSAAAFGLYVYTVNYIDPRQQIINVALWLLGTAIGIAVGLTAGLSWADRRYAHG